MILFAIIGCYVNCSHTSSLHFVFAYIFSVEFLFTLQINFIANGIPAILFSGRTAEYREHAGMKNLVTRDGFLKCLFIDKPRMEAGKINLFRVQKHHGKKPSWSLKGCSHQKYTFRSSTPCLGLF